MVSDGVSVVISPEDVGLAAEILARAFHTDPPFEYLILDPARRAQLLPRFFERFVRHGQIFGEVYTTRQQPEAVAIWLPPGSTDIPPERARRSGLDELPEVLGGESFTRLTAILARMNDMHHKAMPGDHWYLAFIGVEPDRQGRGIGGALMGPMLARAHHDRVPCYLETFLARNVPFYQRHGFKIVTEGTLPDSGLAFWTMRREP
jgi:GNAT superfamily N-acetyltransferase